MADWINQYESATKQQWEPTKLNAAEEEKFLNWFQSTKLFNSFKEQVASENEIQVDKVDNQRLTAMLLNSKDYDYRGAWKAGIKEKIDPSDGLPHWPSTAGNKLLKSPNHPTLWKEFFMRQYKKDPAELNLSTIEQAKSWSESRKPVIPRAKRRPLLMNQSQ
jgi:hypothetical protein